jgi:hypothetical protein
VYRGFESLPLRQPRVRYRSHLTDHLAKLRMLSASCDKDVFGRSRFRSLAFAFVRAI